ncbi:hypothetical protein F5X96DRAFT_348112 [Biscogniauxia mediterranea]|nr:hypothetical protein F5X96DRAFT_348112 [Biscogniauxia mediterranea]
MLAFVPNLTSPSHLTAEGILFVDIVLLLLLLHDISQHSLQPLGGTPSFCSPFSFFSFPFPSSILGIQFRGSPSSRIPTAYPLSFHRSSTVDHLRGILLTHTTHYTSPHHTRKKSHSSLPARCVVFPIASDYRALCCR